MAPLFVSALMATSRPAMRERARKEFIPQTYQNAVLQLDPGPGLHGEKMDQLFRKCLGEIAIIWDDDDCYAPDRIAKLVKPFEENSRLLCVGTSLVYYVDERIAKAWLYDNSKVQKSLFWLAAPAYRRIAYTKYGPWEPLKCGADLKFLRKIPREQILDLRDPSLMVCRIHAENAAPKQTTSAAWQEIPIETLPAFYKPLEGPKEQEKA